MRAKSLKGRGREEGEGAPSDKGLSDFAPSVGVACSTREMPLWPSSRASRRLGAGSRA
jgi:hypothetical protein